MSVESLLPAELKQKLSESPNESGGLLLLDVREPHEFALCRIKDSLNIPLSQITRRFSELNEEQETVVICHHGIRSLQAALFLEQNGFSNVFNLAGGIDAWANNIDPTMPRY